MTSTTLTLPLSRGVTLERAGFGLLVAFAATLQLSIAVAQVLLAATLVCWLTLVLRDRRQATAPPFFTPLLAYAAITLAVSFASADPAVSVVDDKQLLLFLVVPAVYLLARGERAWTIVDVVISIGAISATFGIVQFAVFHYDNLGQRPQGTMGHYMTYSGLLMLVITTAVARLIFGRQGRLWAALVLPALVVALELTFGRSAWVGASVAIALLLLLKDFRLLAIVPVAIAVAFAFAPDRVADRMVSIFDRKDPTSRDRVAMLQAGAAIIRDHPFTGVGPNMVPAVYPNYRVPGAVNTTNPHLHNVPMHIAAERGLVALAAWVWFLTVTVVGLVRLLAVPSVRALAAAALAAVTAMLAAGFFEYNFGDSEFLMLFLVLITLPFAASAASNAPSQARPARG